MSEPLSTLRVAIVGAGPSGFFAAEALQKAAPGIRIDLLDRLPTPFGLVRGGVAPDHPKIKSVTRVYDRIATQPGFRFLGHVEVGSDVTIEALRAAYDAVILANGARTDRPLGIPGEQLAGSHAATEFVGWYNGHPDYAEATFDLGQRAVAVVGLGNVAMDVTRVLAKSPDVLATTDLAAHALAALRDSQVRTVHVIGRRGPVQAACTTPELRELGELEGVDVLVDPRDLDLDPISAAHLASSEDRTAEKNLQVLREWAERGSTGATRRIVFHFNASPVELLGDDRVTGLRVVRNRLEDDGQGGVRAVPTDVVETLEVGLVFRSVGYRGVPIDGVPFDARRGTIPNAAGRVLDADGEPIAGLYTAGWIKRGPSGVIGTNKSCAAETVASLIADVAAGQVGRGAGDPDALLAELDARGVRRTDWADWQRLDAEEQARGAAAGRPREKITEISAMLRFLQKEI
ncbi:MAG TPA: FAD-dependent oxidoreductase [Gemmatimonadales bacterium]|nr:FAD-dependent oxidoreductase [Gemmatimonadales bacterium]